MSILEAKTTNPQEGGASFSLRNRAIRLIWSITWLLLARWTPGVFNPWRLLLLRLFGARIAPGAAIAGSARVWLPSNLALKRYCTVGPQVDCYNMAPLTIGEYTIISQGAVLCGGSHDIHDKDFQLLARPITIGDRVWVASQAFVGPGVVIGDGAVLGARACAFHALEPWTVYVGNPAVKTKARRFVSAP
jgi:putative colanic acid biosynthesis acetyltransferase WcaF